jgi:hypothetical protein
MAQRPLLRTIVADEIRLLTFRSPSPAIREHWRAYLLFGLVATWAAGIGRYWDNPKAYPWQHWGLGSVAYVFVLALIIWVVLAPLRPKNWAYRNVLLFITLTAPPALLYAIPVEQFVPMSTAQAINAWFLAIVAAWRVALLFAFLRRVAGLGGITIVVAALVPLVLIVNGLAFLNLEHVVFDFMAGIREQDQSSADTAYVVVWWISVLSILLSPLLLAAYAAMIYRAWRAI